MKCWKCGQDIEENTTLCIYCGSNQKRKSANTIEGAALRKIYDRFGSKNVFSNKSYLENAIGDALENSSKLRNCISMAFDVGIGELYLFQLENSGCSDENFRHKIKTLLIEDAGLSEKTSIELISYFDEMIGWENISNNKEIKPTDNSHPTIHNEQFSSQNQTSQIDNSAIQSQNKKQNNPTNNTYKTQEYERRRRNLHILGYFIATILFIIVLVFFTCNLNLIYLILSMQLAIILPGNMTMHSK